MSLPLPMGSRAAEISEKCKKSLDKVRTVMVQSRKSDERMRRTYGMKHLHLGSRMMRMLASRAEMRGLIAVEK